MLKIMNLTDYAYDLLMEGLQPLPLRDNKAPLLDKGHNYLYDLVNENELVYRIKVISVLMVVLQKKDN